MDGPRAAGSYPSTPDDEYFAEPRLSNSRCSTLLSYPPAQFRWEWDHPDEVDEHPGKGVKVGTQLHELVLNPDEWLAKYVRGPTGDARTKAYKVAWAETQAATGCTPLDGDEYDMSLRVLDQVRAHPRLGKLLAISERIDRELMICWDEEHYGVPVPWKAKVDLAVPSVGVFVDWKFLADVGEHALRRAMFRYGWHRQTLVYERGMAALGDPKQGIIVAVQKSAPHLIHARFPSDWFRDIAARQIDKVIAIYTECTQSGVWPSYPDDPEPIDPEAWMENA